MRQKIPLACCCTACNSNARSLCSSQLCLLVSTAALNIFYPLSLSRVACYTWPVTCFKWLQVAVLVLAGLGKFTLWGAVLVDVGTALCVILHGMLLMRWRLPGAKPSAKYSATCVERHEPLATNGITGQSSCCSSKQCSAKVVVQQDGNCAAKSVDGTSCCSSNKQCSGKVATMQSEDGAAKSVMGKPNCCSSNKQCSNKMAADDNEDGAANSIVGKPDCCSSSKDCSGKAASPTNGNASKSPCCSKQYSGKQAA